MLAARLSHWKTLAIHTSSHNHLTSSSSSGGDLSGGENYGDDDGDGKDDCDGDDKDDSVSELSKLFFFCTT